MKKLILQSKSLTILFIGLVYVASMFSFFGNIHALDTPAITVTPGSVNVELTEANQTVESEIEITSNYPETVDLEVALKSVDESSGVLVASEALDENLSKIISLSESQITVPANGKTTISLIVKNSDLLSPGGHYAAVSLTQVGSDDSQISLQSTISIGVFIIKRGGEKIAVSIQEQNINISKFKLPDESSITYLNTGNVLATPRASLTIRSIDGNKVYAKGISNEGSLSILPGKTLTDTFAIERISKLPLVPSKLKYITEYRADTSSNAQYTEIVSWYIPPLFVLFLVTAFFTLILILTKIISRKRKKIKKPKIHTKTGKQPKKSASLISDVTPASKQNKK